MILRLGKHLTSLPPKEEELGSLGEVDLDQMVRDYIESELPTSISMASSAPSTLNHQHKYLSLHEILGKYTDGEAEIHEKVLMYVKELGTSMDQERNLNKLMALIKKLRGDGYEASLCKTSWVSTSKHSKVFQDTGVYEYVDVVMVEKDGRVKRVIVDLDFRSQFELPRPTATYSELTNILPLIFVGSEEKLEKTIPLLCSAAKESFKEKDLHIPPWRKTAYMQSKWLSKNCKKVSVSPRLGEDKREEKNNASTFFPCTFSRGQLLLCLKP